jgi:hypothetical protein
MGRKKLTDKIKQVPIGVKESVIEGLGKQTIQNECEDRVEKLWKQFVNNIKRDMTNGKNKN